MKRKGIEVIIGRGTPRQRYILKERELEQKSLDSINTLEAGHRRMVAELKQTIHDLETKNKELVKTVNEQQLRITKLEANLAG